MSQGRRGPTDEQWLQCKPVIQRLYMGNDTKLGDLLWVLQELYELPVTFVPLKNFRC